MSESLPLVSSSSVSKWSPLVRGLDSALCSFRAMSMRGALVNLGSQGMGLLGSLDEQFGMLVCRCGGAVEEKELRRGDAGSLCGVDMVSEVMGEGKGSVCVCRR